MPALFRRRLVWWPTLTGSLILAVAALLLFGWAGRGLAGFLSVNEPARGPGGEGAHTLVVEGWLERADLDQALAAIRRHGRYERVLTTGAPFESWDGEPVWPSHAERAAAYLRAHGAVGVPVIAVPAPASAQDRTFLSAVMVREWARRQGVALQAIDVFSAGVHTRRSRWLYRLALGTDTEVGALAAAPRDGDPARWWAASGSAKAVVGEALGLAWTACCFWPPAQGSHEERWAVPLKPSAAH